MNEILIALLKFREDAKSAKYSEDEMETVLLEVLEAAGFIFCR